MSKVIIGLSGGVDSAVAAYLLKEQGYDVVGVTLRTWVSDTGEDGRCCEIDDARAVAIKLGIPFHAPNCVDMFREQVIEPFMQCYVDGMTPNPCVICNRVLKFERMLYEAKVLSADYIATGHYAEKIRLNNGRYTVKVAKHAEKDQTYMLYRLSQEQLEKTLMPLADLSKAEVRDIARNIGLSVSEKKDSQEICFIPDGHYSEYIEQNYKGELPGRGHFVDESGKILGDNPGILHYTVGQRKGLGIALGSPAYVKEFKGNDVVLAPEESLYTKEVICSDVNFLSIDGIAEGERVNCLAKIRYHHKAKEAVLEKMPDGCVRVTFTEPVKAATPGQSCVFYHEDGYVIGGGIIQKQE